MKTFLHYYFLVFLGLSFYLFMLFIRVIRKLRDGMIVSENITELRLGINLYVTLVFLCILLILINILYKILVKDTTTSKFGVWLQRKAIVFQEYIEQMHKTTIQELLRIIPNIARILPFILINYSKVIFAAMNKYPAKTCIMMFFLISGIPAIVSICFLIDAYNNQYYYFTNTVILLIIPLITKAIWYACKYIAEYIIIGMKEDYEFEVNEFKIIEFGVLSDTPLDNELENEKDIQLFLQQEYKFCQHLHDILYCDSMWSVFPELFPKIIVFVRFVTILNFFVSWVIISYYSLGYYFM
jgi:hypothetical protein